MKNCILYLACTFLLFGCVNGQTKKGAGKNDFAAVPAAKPGEQVATFGGGCFWSMSEALSELKGVNKVVAGFAGGSTANPTYEDVCTRTTGHAETVQVYYDPKVISYETLAEGFFSAHDPTTLNKQGPDEGTDYRSIAFYRTTAEKATLENVIKKVNASKHYNNPVVTQVVPFKVFYAAENYHQGYYKANPGSFYIQSVSKPKVEKFRKAMKAYLR
ncbi:peptide-methionine (S)-S-oxide reductase MsrA [Mucilaginibacter gynuensis]|uniref:Peptide methionine sulfoxide reductase MsrA n=1 Tax=Mucilaginibacter gynuensis TaxID=1302236 RepID=A0ABP8H306_9SPHI